jgi:hypothetical protein
VRLTSTLAALLVVSAGASASASGLSTGALAARDPGARVGGNTIVTTAAGDRTFGVRGRPNFIMALGSNETITGGNKADELGARGSNVTIRAGRGDDVVYGGPGGTLVGGPGHDLLIETQPNGTIMVGGGDEVVATGRHDRVLCSARARKIVIYRGATDSVSHTCRADHAKLLSAKPPPTPRLAHVAAAAITGNGSSATPFQAPCDQVFKDSCTVSSFPARDLDGLWANEFVPAYQCPDDHQYLYYKRYGPFGTTIPAGVEIQQESGFPIGISITATVRPKGADLIGRTYGTATGFPNSSATNWALGKKSYKVILHCTNLPNLAAQIF